MKRGNGNPLVYFRKIYRVVQAGELVTRAVRDAGVLITDPEVAYYSLSWRIANKTDS